MTTEEIIIHIFCYVDDNLPEIEKHGQAKLYPSELVTIGILFAIKVPPCGIPLRGNGYFRAPLCGIPRIGTFYRWLSRDFSSLFGGLPHRSRKAGSRFAGTRLLRLLKTHQDWCNALLAEPSFFTVIDTYPIELLFPIREGRSNQQVGKKSKDKGRWFIGVKLCWLLNEQGQVVAWDWNSANTPDKEFHHLVKPFVGETIVLADFGFRDAEGSAKRNLPRGGIPRSGTENREIPENLKLCPKGTWNERMVIETALSMVTVVCDLKRIRHRRSVYIQTRLAFMTAMFNVLLALFHQFHPAADVYQISIAEFSL